MSDPDLRRHHLVRFPVLVTAVLVSLISSGAEDDRIQKRLELELEAFPAATWVRSAIGVTRQGTPIPCFLTEDDFDPNSRQRRILVVGGLEGDRASLQSAIRIARELRTHEGIAVSVVPCVRPDGLETGNLAAPLRFPPEGNAYLRPENDIAHYLWRWIGMHAPDLVFVASGQTRSSADSLVAALESYRPANTGTIPATSFTPASAISREGFVAKQARRKLAVSPARQEVQRRIDRTAIEVAEELAPFYGHQLDRVTYIPALAIVGRLRLGELNGDRETLPEVESLVAVYGSGKKESLPDKTNGSTLSGHLVFAELAHRTGDSRWQALARKAADYGFEDDGEPKASMPFHNEMSDAVFMGCAILAETGRLTGEAKYYEQCLRHFQFVEQLCRRDDGLYRHSPLDEAAWGRGNGFPALGLALSLSAIPENRPEHPAMLASYRDHLDSLRRHQDPTGAWHQVVDREESYREFTSTCMITFAVVRGMRRGWLDPADWRPVADQAWIAIKSRIGPGGELVDVCTGTGKQENLRAYFDRTAILGKDDRGGAMALMVSTEIASWENEIDSR